MLRLLLLNWKSVRGRTAGVIAVGRQATANPQHINTRYSSDTLLYQYVTKHTLLAQDRKSVKHFSRGPRALRSSRAARTAPMRSIAGSYTATGSSVLGAQGRQRAVYHDTRHPYTSWAAVPPPWCAHLFYHDLRVRSTNFLALLFRRIFSGRTKFPDPNFNSIGQYLFPIFNRPIV